MKTMLELVVAVILLVVAAPVIALLAAAVKATSPGPAFYSQLRLGRFGRPFRIYKLRTMTHECERATGAVWSGPHDPRVTRIGRLLRQTHLDELPQLWNVVRGEMSLIGPRPERPEIAAELARQLPGYDQRLRVRPGLTGLAQVQFPPDLGVHDVAQKLSQDLFYIEHVSLFLDARIAASTSMLFVSLAFDEARTLLIAGTGRAARQAYPPARVADDAVWPAPIQLKPSAFDVQAKAATTRDLSPAA